MRFSDESGISADTHDYVCKFDLAVKQAVVCALHSQC